MFVSNQAFIETPDGNNQHFTTIVSLYDETLIISQGTSLIVDFDVFDEHTVDFTTAPVVGETLRWSGEIQGEESLSDYISDLTDRIHDEEEKLDMSSLIGCVNQAIAEYSKTFPLQGIVFGHGSCISFPTTWAEHFSRVLRCYEPVDGFLECVDLVVEIKTAMQGKVLVIEDAEATKVYGISFTRPQTCESITAYRSEVLDLAAHYALNRMANAYIQERQETIGAMDLPRIPKVLEYQKMARQFLQSWTAFIGSQAGGCFHTWNADTDLLFQH